MSRSSVRRAVVALALAAFLLPFAGVSCDVAGERHDDVMRSGIGLAFGLQTTNSSSFGCQGNTTAFPQDGIEPWALLALAVVAAGLLAGRRLAASLSAGSGLVALFLLIAELQADAVGGGLASGFGHPTPGQGFIHFRYGVWVTASLLVLSLAIAWASRTQATNQASRPAHPS